jgi:hypothetical protein
MKIVKSLKKAISFTKKRLKSKPKKIRYVLCRDTPRQQKNIIFLLPALRYPNGGGIVAHSHCQLIQDIKYKNFTSQMLYPEEPKFSPTLFKHADNLKKDLNLNPATDFIVIPEIYAAEHAEYMVEMGVPYAINVQNGYLINFELIYRQKNMVQLNFAYENASIVIGISEDTNQNIQQLFPSCMNKLMKSYYVIDKATFKPFKDKKNIITYMPRKLPRHSLLVCFHLANMLPPDWELRAIDGVSEQEVYDILAESKIFLSFSEFEGLAMPPVMAALSGNVVVGYTGEGNKEYFSLACFQEIPCGDIKAFAEKVIEVINLMSTGGFEIDEAAIGILSKMFSREKQQQFLMQLIDAVDAGA